MTSDEQLSQLKQIAMELLEKYEDSERLVIVYEPDDRFLSKERQNQYLSEDIADYRNRITQLTEE